MFLDTYKEALLEEYNFLSKSNNRIPLFDGKYEYADIDGYVYSFMLNKEFGVPDGTPVYVYIDSPGINYISSVSGSVVYSEGYEIVIKVKKIINIKSKVEFTSAVHELLKMLVERLNGINYNDFLVDSLIHGKDLCIDGNPEKGQKKAIAMSLSNPITIIWGPPGTGKTHTLAEIALKCFEHGKRVLILSQSNIAVDNAMLKIKQFVRERSCYGSLKGNIFRAGYSKIKEVFSVLDENDFYINARQYVEKNNPELIKELNQLLEKAHDKETDSVKKKEITDRIHSIRSFIRSKEDELIVSAQILGTTISKATVDILISNNRYDVVLFDEASMAYVPQIVYACSLAKEHFICIGDFRQLPPIVQCGEKNILNIDIFEFLGIYKAPIFSNHQWLVMLNTQRRMHSTISYFVREKIYSQHLTDHHDTDIKTRNILDKAPLPGYSIGYFDMDKINCSAQSKEVGKTHSHSNFISAYISVLIALSAKKSGQDTVAIISPYKNQVNLIKAILLDLHVGQENGVYCSTIHQFQGRESNVIIFDTVDAYPMKKIGKMLSQGDNSNRLINVAMTRAEGKFILLGSRCLGQGNCLLGELWKYVIQKGRSLSLNSLIKLDFTPRLSRLKSIDEVVSVINNSKRSDMMVAFNNQVLQSHTIYFNIINNVVFSDDDYVFIDKTVENNKLAFVASQINRFVKLKIGYKSDSFYADNIFVLNERQIIFPIFSLQNNSYVYFCHNGKYLVNILKDLQYEQLIEESNLKSEIDSIKAVDPNKWIKCPICELNYIHEGEEMCNICSSRHAVTGFTVITEKDRVSLWDICKLWADLSGEWNLKRFWNKKRKILKNVIHNNKKIAHIYAVADWNENKKVPYYNKNDVFREFFLGEKTIGPVISELGISSYSELESNIIFVSSKIV